MTETEIGVASTNQGMPKFTSNRHKVEKGKEESSPGAFRKSTGPATTLISYI